ncbi:MAG TPA: acyl-CoA dehydrogenase family protein, partial [Myxococcota bacterium]|nr:acyl-CoA dehydrogenase family protein [Myxococcota bacterium]
LGGLNEGFYSIMSNFQGERLAAAIISNRGMEISVQEAMEYMQSRAAFGKPLSKNQVWKHKFAELMTAIRAAKMLSYHAVDTLNSGENPTLEVSMAKLFSCDLAQRVAYDCLQAHGGYGFVEEYDIARYFRDVRLFTIGGGTSEIMKEIIAKWSGL